MKKLQVLFESALFFAVVYLVYEIMEVGYIYVVRLGMVKHWSWVDKAAYNQYNLEQASLYYVKDHPVEYTLLCWAVIMLILIIVVIATKGQTMKDMSITWLRPSEFLISVLIGLGLVFVINGITGILIDAMDVELTYIPEKLYTSYNFLFLLIGVGVVAPIAEELFFRGLIMGRLHKGFGEIMTVVLTGIIFSISHLNISQSLFVLPVGLLCGYLVIKTGSVFAGIWLHIVYNVVNIYLAKMAFFQYNSLQLLILVVSGAGLLYFGISQINALRTNP